MFQWVYSLYKINFQQMLCDVYTFFLCLCFFLKFCWCLIGRSPLVMEHFVFIRKICYKTLFFLSLSLSCKDFTCSKDEATNFICWFFNDFICRAYVYWPSVKPTVPIMSAIFLSVFLSGFLVAIINREGLLLLLLYFHMSVCLS